MTLPRVTVVGLGPSGPELTTNGAVAALEAADARLLRTERHPAAVPFAGVETCDDLYESESTFADVYAAVVERIVDRATAAEHLTYAVPGSPFVLERTVELLLSDARVDVGIVPGMSFLDLAWGALAIDPIESRVRLVDGHRFAVDAADATGALLVAHCHSTQVLSDIKLAFDDHEPERAVVLQRLGLPDQVVTEVAWADLDRSVEADHLTSVFIPAVTRSVAASVVRLEQLVRTLREQCPWDREQTHDSLTRYLLEETHELLEAIDGFDVASGDGLDELEEELGDVLFQVVFHAAIAAERGDFTLSDVADRIHDKLHSRHPHVFGDVVADDPAAVVAQWERQKAVEKGRDSILDGIPAALPGLAHAHAVLSKAERVGAPATAPVEPAGDLGSALLGLVEWARRAGTDAEGELRRAIAALRARVEHHERRR